MRNIKQDETIVPLGYFHSLILVEHYQLFVSFVSVKIMNIKLNNIASSV